MLRLFLIAFCLVVPNYCLSSTSLPTDYCGNTDIAQHQPTLLASFPIPGDNNNVNNTKFHLRLSGVGGRFSGFVIQALDPNSASVGKFKIIECNKSNTMACKKVDDTTTHAETSQESPLASVEFIWLSFGYQGNARFVATVAPDGEQWKQRILKEINVVTGMVKSGDELLVYYMPIPIPNFKSGGVVNNTQ